MPVTRIDIETRGALNGGAAFGEAGAYEDLTGTLHFTADPKHPDHGVICDLDLAPTNAQGLVEYSAQFHLLKPVAPKAGGRPRTAAWASHAALRWAARPRSGRSATCCSTASPTT